MLQNQAKRLILQSSLKVENLTRKEIKNAKELHQKFEISKGESEAIILAQRYKNCALILDDLEAREIAKARGIMLTDTLILPLEALASKKMENIAKEEQTDKSSIIRKLLDRAIKEWKLERATDMYKERKVTLEKASELAEVSVRELINYLKEKELEIGNLSSEDLDADIKQMYKRVTSLILS